MTVAPASSEIAFHSPQSVHCPAHLVETEPQAEQTKRFCNLDMKPLLSETNLERKIESALVLTISLQAKPHDNIMADALINHLRTQLLGTFLAPGSTLSLVALAINFAIACVFLALACKRKRDIGFGVTMRALFPDWLWRSSSGRADIAWFAYSLIGSGLLIGWALISSRWIAEGLHSLIGAPTFWSAPAWLALSVATLAAFVAYEFSFWLDHFLMHKLRFLWMFHRVHHSAEHLSLLTNTRVHPIETIGFYNLAALLTGLTEGLLPVLLGPEAGPAKLGGVNLLVLVSAVAITHLQHSRFWVRFGPRLGRILMGPAHHQLHHSSDPAHYDCNLGGSIALFDRLFGTFLMPERARQNIDFGIGQQDFDPHSLANMTLRPFVDSADALRHNARGS